jgi:Na+:H+ antiporter, NhaA family
MTPTNQGTDYRSVSRRTRISFLFKELLHNAAAAGILLLLAAVAALIWANSPWGDAYQNLWATKITVGADNFGLTKSLHHWINDGLMVIFFFVVGLEIKRELLVGELASPRRAALPAIAAVGGAVVPALIYIALNAGTDGSSGWAVPMATDIAFVIGILALLGNRVPLSLKIFLTALAIVDDLMAVLVIAIFYTSELAWNMLGIAGLFLLVLIAANRLHIRQPLVYLVLGIGLWVATLQSGVHATIAGVVLAMTIPARTLMDEQTFVAKGRALLDRFEQAGMDGQNIITNEEQQSAVQELEAASAKVTAPLQRIEKTLHPWVLFGVMPLFALANAGVVLEGDVTSAFDNRVTIGVILGLVIGKQIGITLFVWLATRLGPAALPEAVSWRQIYGAGWLAGIGFTMSLFIADLAFADAGMLASAKIGILAASVIAGVVGSVLLIQATSSRTVSAKEATTEVQAT